MQKRRKTITIITRKFKLAKKNKTLEITENKTVIKSGIGEFYR
jgi:hypothetical protein